MNVPLGQANPRLPEVFQPVRSVSLKLSLRASTLILAALLPAPAGLAAERDALRRAPTVAKVDLGALPAAELLGTPEVHTLLGYTRRALHLHDGHTLAVFSYSNTGVANWLFLLDARDLSVERFAIPNNDVGSHAAALGSDGNIYLMPYHTGRAYRFEVAARRFVPLEVKAGLPPGEYTWDAIGAPDGCIYFGTYPNACVGRYEIATGKWTHWKQVAPNTKYVTAFSVTESGVRFKAWGPDEVWMTCGAESSAPQREHATAANAPATQQSPPPPGEESFVRELAVDGRRFAIGFPSSRLYELPDNGKPIIRGETGAPAEMWFLEHVGDTLMGISHYGATFRYDIRSDRFTRGRMPNNAPAGNSIMFIQAITPDCVIGANYSHQNFFRVHPRTGKIISGEQMAARMPGQPECAVGLNGKGYIGFYIHSILSMYDPAAPIAFGKNPRELAELHTEHQQTRPSDAITDGRLVYISSESDYNYLGGALTVIDPKPTGQERVDVYFEPAGDQNLTSLVYDAKNELVWGGTDRWGQMHSVPPTQPTAVIYAFDPAKRKVAATIAPWKSVDVTSVIGCTDDGTLLAYAGGEIATIDGLTRRIIHQGAWPVMPSRKMQRGSDSRHYFLAGGTVYRWDAAPNTLTPIATAPGCTFLTEPSPGLWLLAGSASVYRVRLKQ